MSQLPFFMLLLEKILGFKQCGSNRKFKVLCLNKILYDFCKSLCVFWKYLTEKLGNCGLPQAPSEPSLCIGKDQAICYIYDLIIWARREKDNIVKLTIRLHAKELIKNKRMMLLDFFEFTSSTMLKPDFSK